MSESIDKFTKPVNTALTADRPQTSGGSPEDPSQQRGSKPERRRGFRPIHGIAIGTTALLAAGGAVLWGVNQSQGEKPNEAAATSAPLDPSEAPAEPVTEPAPSEAPAEPVTQPEVGTIGGEGLPTVEELPNLSDEEIAALAAVTIESVTNPDGTINWGLYSQKLIDRIELSLNAGASEAEVQGAASHIVVAENAARYLPAFQKGYGIDGFILPEEFAATHQQTVNTAYMGNFVNSDPVRTTVDIAAPVDVKEDLESEAVLDLTLNVKDNFFSSGALNIDAPQEYEQFRPEGGDKNATVELQFYVLKNSETGELQLGRIDPVRQ